MIDPIFKFDDPNESSNYHTMMIGHTFAKLYATIIDKFISQMVDVRGFIVGG